MFKSKTLFVVGAGASAEAGLPIGSELTAKIAALLQLELQYENLTKGDRVIFNALRKLAGQPEWVGNQFLGSGRGLAEAMDLAQSIDTFLESHSGNREYVQLGKLGIVRAIAIAEASSKLQPTKDGQSPFILKNLSNTWYYSLARQLFSGVSVDNPEKAFDNVSFVVFNYDRCLQVFLIQAAQKYFTMNAQQAGELISRVNFIHPYGSLGSIFECSVGRVPFASHDFDILTVANSIRTYSETSNVAAAIRQRVCAAETLIFLGFGFHEQNIDLLDVFKDSGVLDGGLKRIFATTMGMSTSDEAVVRDQISYALYGRPLSKDDENSISTNCGTCADLFSMYWRSLTA